MLDIIFKILFPPKCVFCRKVLDERAKVNICAKCESNLPRIEGVRCVRCGVPLKTEHAMKLCLSCRKHMHVFEKVFSPLEYGGVVREAMLRFKFSEKKSYARTFALMIAEEILKDPPHPFFEYITYVPISRKRLKMRGYNQAELIAKELGYIFKLPVILALINNGSGSVQSKLSHKERIKNAKKIFEIKKGVNFGGVPVLLVDDIYTTGATANACSALLKKIGARKVYVATAAQTVNKF